MAIEEKGDRQKLSNIKCDFKYLGREYSQMLFWLDILALVRCSA